MPLVARGLLDRGLMRLQAAPWPPRVFFTEAGLVALRALVADRRFAHPVMFAHVRQEFGIDPFPDEPQPGLRAKWSLRRRRFLPRSVEAPVLPFAHAETSRSPVDCEALIGFRGGEVGTVARS